MAEYEVFSSESIDQTLTPCNHCGRTFMPETLVKHSRICAKTSNKTRKVFQSGNQRAQGSDVPITSVLKSGAPPPKPKGNASNKSNWRQKHEEFITGLKAARGVSEALASGKPLPPAPPPATNPDYVSCPSCERRFNPGAAERHIPFCKEKNKRIPDKKTIDPSAIRRMQARVNYKTAKPKIKGREDTMYNPNQYQSNSGRGGSGGGGGLEANGYSAPMRTGKTERNYNDGLKMRSGSLDRRKNSGAGDSRKPALTNRVNSHEALSRLNGSGSENGYDGYYSPSPPGRPPSGSYQHRTRDGSGHSGRGRESGRSNASGDKKTQAIRHTNGQTRQSSASKFCHDCGNKYCRMDAKFCCECGLERLYV